jgi:uncharacterized protein
MDLITDIPLIERRARQNERQDVSFRAFLKGSEMPDRKLDEIVHRTTDMVWKQIDCTTCGNCCRTLQVPVDDEDAARLAARLKVTKEQFLAEYVTPGDDPDTPFIFAASPCSFLGDGNRCTVYEDRPKACRDYPFLYRDDFRGRTFLTIGNLSVCPIVHNVWESLKGRLWRWRR